ncbi:MAG TPA: hypothetical protein VLB79_11845 [Solirubrobacterales bacterium]|nr:hypothetical protein [Solirubrobacterales bacterium]
MESYAGTGRATAARARGALGGVDGNELLTSATAVLLVVLLAAEGITLLDFGGLLSVHMFIGLVLIPPVLLKLASTGYRFARYYLRAPAYREKGPPLLPLRILAPVLAATTVGVLATGVWLLLLGHKSDQVLFLHKALFIAWSVVFGIHFLAYAPRMLRSVFGSTQRLPGTGVRGTLVAASLGAGVALALSLASAIAGWHA